MARPPPPPVSAPDLTGPVSILNWPVAGAGHRSARRLVYAHVRLEIDLVPERVRDPGLPVFDRLEALLKEREVVEVGDLLRLTGRVLHAFGAVGFARVDHWEVDPGGWLALPEATHARLEEPIGHLLRALEDDHWKGLAARRGFSVRLSGRPPYRADVEVRWRHRERRHALSVDLRGTITPPDVRSIVGAVRDRVPLLRAQVVAHEEK